MDMAQDAPSQASQSLPAAAEPVASTPSPPGGKEDVSQCGSPSPTDDEKVLRCTFKECKAKAEDRVFIGKGARTAHKRHMDTHLKPYKCPETGCGRNKNGFSRKDNLNIHLKSHAARPAAGSPGDGALKHLERRAASPSPEETLRRIDHVALRDTTQLLVKIANKLMERLETAQLDGDSLNSGMQIDTHMAESDIVAAGESALSPPLSGSE